MNKQAFVLENRVKTITILIEQSSHLVCSNQNYTLYLSFLNEPLAVSIMKPSGKYLQLKAYLPKNLINLIKAMHTNASYKVLHRDYLSKSISFKTGVIQGCVLSRIVFNIGLDYV